MRVKKVRGIKRKLHKMRERIKENSLEFPTEFTNGYWHLKLPVAQDFINSENTPNKVKRMTIQTLLDRAEYLMRLKPNDVENYRVVVAVDLPALWGSQIIIFKGDSYFKDFFNRNDEHQKWLPLSDERKVQSEWELSIPSHFQVLGFKEVITDEDAYHYEGEIWFIGELK